MHENEIGTIILDCAFRVHRTLGPGLFESVYETCLCHELTERGVTIERQIPLPLKYDGIKIGSGFRIDIVADKKVVVEVKAIEKLAAVHMAQLITYLKLSDCKLGYLLNFNVKFMRTGVKRVVLGKL